MNMHWIDIAYIVFMIAGHLVMIGLLLAMYADLNKRK